MSEIKAEIDSDKPFICCLGTTRGLDRNYQNYNNGITTPGKIKIAAPEDSRQFIEIVHT